MFWTSHRRAGTLLLVLGSLLASASRSSAAAPADDGATAVKTSPAGLLEIDIPAQPLTDALKRYALLVRQPALFRSDLVAGLMSAPVAGRYTPEVALRLLLDGTGLVPERVQGAPDGAFILRQAAVRRAELGDLAGYPALVQARILESLCSDDRTMPGTYRSLLRFQVDTSGQIQHARLLGTTGSSPRDAAILASLRRTRIGLAPPPAVPQPMTMLILPASPGAPAGGACPFQASPP